MLLTGFDDTHNPILPLSSSTSRVSWYPPLRTPPVQGSYSPLLQLVHEGRHAHKNVEETTRNSDLSTEQLPRRSLTSFYILKIFPWKEKNWRSTKNWGENLRTILECVRVSSAQHSLQFDWHAGTTKNSIEVSWVHLFTGWEILHVPITLFEKWRVAWSFECDPFHLLYFIEKDCTTKSW